MTPTRRGLLAATLFTLILIASPLLGCDAGDVGETATVDRKPVIGVSIPAADHGWTGGVVYWAEKAKADFAADVEVRVQTAASPEEQIAQIETMLTSGVDAIVILATESAPLTPTAKTVKERGVYLVNVDRGFLDPVADVYVAGDNAEFGRVSAKFMADKLGGEGNVVFVTGIPSTVDTARVEAAREVFAEHPGIDILDSVPGQWNRETAQNAMAGLLQKHSDIDAVWAGDDDMAEGIEQAIREAGRAGEMWIMPGAGKKGVVKKVMDGEAMYPANVTYPPGMIYAGVALAKAKLVGGDLASAAEDLPDYLGLTRQMIESAAAQEGQKKVTLPVRLITPENAGQFYFPESVY